MCLRTEIRHPEGDVLLKSHDLQALMKLAPSELNLKKSKSNKPCFHIPRHFGEATHDTSGSALNLFTDILIDGSASSQEQKHTRPCLQGLVCGDTRETLQSLRLLPMAAPSLTLSGGEHKQRSSTYCDGVTSRRWPLRRPSFVVRTTASLGTAGKT